MICAPVWDLRFFAGVHAQMHLHVALVRERFVAKVASVEQNWKKIEIFSKSNLNGRSPVCKRV